MQETLSSSQSSQIINALHSILKPFLLRRLKADVEVLPPKKEYVLYAPLSVKQRGLYDHALGGRLRDFLIGKGKDSQNEEIDVEAPMKLRRKKRRRWVEEDDDDEFFDDPELGDLQEKHKPADIAEIAREDQHKSTGMCFP
jgi:ATP-dependent DNA helicase